MIKAVIIDDDELARLTIKKYIERSDKTILMGEFDSAVNVLENPVDCDLIYLDVEMPEMTGLEFIEKAKNIPHIIICSSKAEYAAEAFNYNVTDYLVKPVDYTRFLQALAKLEKIQHDIIDNNSGRDHIFLKKKNTHIRVNFEDISHVEALADYVNIFTDTDRYTMLSTMKAIEQRFPADAFLRIHRSFSVRLDKIKEIEENSVSINNKTIPVSRSHKESLMNQVNLF